ncbi:MAG TPA: glucosidase, partial [Polyangia bacterium]
MTHFPPGSQAGDAGEAERQRLDSDGKRQHNWKRFGPYLSERQWGTVREDYSADGNCWEYFPHDHARSRAYRWGEDGLLGICDRQGRLCFALALWNGADPILKERLFGLTGPEGNHGEDVKEHYFYLDSTPTHSYMKALYKYPQRAFPYAALVEENRRRGKHDPEFELGDTGVFDDNRYFDVFAEYAKASPDDILIRLTIANRGPEAAPLALLPTLWFRNLWSWGRAGEGYCGKPVMAAVGEHEIDVQHPLLGHYRLAVDPANAPAQRRELIFTENETNSARLFGAANPSPFVKDGFHEYVVGGHKTAINPARVGTKAAALMHFTIAAGQEITVRLRLTAHAEANAARDPFSDFDSLFVQRLAEADAYYDAKTGPLARDESLAVRQAYAGLLWSKQFYHYDVRAWLQGDPAHPMPPSGRSTGRNVEWQHLYNRDVLSMPDKWEYPWFAAWDLAFHMIPFARIDPHFAKEQ